ncbi:MAG: hypothetical protein HY064_11580 [Bacteroidetes bacterium]|nr:hypothetical protein [Bacteroidota bacterium]
MKTFSRKFIFLLAIAVSPTMEAQSFLKGQKDINLGIGIGNNIVRGGGTHLLPPISFSFDYGITGAISVGGYLGVTGASYIYSAWENCGNGNGNGQYYTDTYKWHYDIYGIRGAYHFAQFIKMDKLDAYGGIMLGYDYAHYRYTTTSTCPGHVGYYGSITYGGAVFSAYAGARYRFTDKIGAFAELGYGISYLTIGVNFKF